MSRPLFARSLSGAFVALSISACTAPQVGSPCPIPTNADNKTRLEYVQKCFGLVANVTNDFRLKKDVDILFVIDNSPSMSPKQRALAENIPKFIQKIEEFDMNYHVGIITTDVGTTVSESAVWGGGYEPACDKFRGDDGELQIKTCDQRNTVSPDASAACTQLCPDNRFRPTNGNKFISKIDNKTNVPQDIQLDPKTGKMVDYGPSRAFKCMALVGDAGCGVEGPLEAMRRAVDLKSATNTGFLRNGSVLAVLMITDEDDCSVKASKRTELDPSYRNCNAAQPDSYDCYKLDQRCLFRSLKCNEPMTTPGGKTGCVERVDSFLEPVKTYYEALLKLGRPTNKLLVSGIWTQPKIDIANGGTVGVVGGPLTSDLKRDPACRNATDATIVGQPQYRLSQFASMFGFKKDGSQQALEVNVCDTADYPKALDDIAKLIEEKFAPCIPVTVKTQNGVPICLVGDVDETTPDAVPNTYFPQCTFTCCDAWASTATPGVGDASIKSACANEQADACFCAVKSKVASVCTEGVNGGTVMGVWRKGGVNTPAGKTVSFRCAGY